LDELERLRELLNEDPARAKAEIGRHLDGPSAAPGSKR
jgi:hypothetical protein